MNWYRDLKSNERRTLWSCFTGWMLDGMDVQIYTFLIPALTAAWSLTKADAGLLQTVALLTSAFGGWITGMLADRVGRVTMLQITILWFAAFTALSGFHAIVRPIAGRAGIAGLRFRRRVGGGIGPDRRGHRRALSRTGRGPGAIGLGAGMGDRRARLHARAFISAPDVGLARGVLHRHGARAYCVLPAEACQRTRNLYSGQKTRAGGRRHARSVRYFPPALIRTTVLGALLSAGANGGYYAITTWLPTFLRETRGLTIFGSAGYIAVIIAGSFAGYLVSAWLTDEIGRRLNFLLFAVSSFATVVVYTIPFRQFRDAVSRISARVFRFGDFFGHGRVPDRAFPTRVRASGQGFCYNFGRGLGAVNPWLVGFLGAAMPLGRAIGVFAGAAYGIVVLAAILLPETRGREHRRHERGRQVALLYRSRRHVHRRDLRSAGRRAFHIEAAVVDPQYDDAALEGIRRALGVANARPSPRGASPKCAWAPPSPPMRFSNARASASCSSPRAA